MTHCCPNCFGDRHLAKDFFTNTALPENKCSYCGAVGQPLLDPSTLRDSFELLMGAYHHDDKGHSLLEWCRRDWSMFLNPDLSDVRATELLADILNDPEFVEQRFVPVEQVGSGTVSQWEVFRKELMFENRFFPDSMLNPERLKTLLEYLLLHEDEYPDKWYRARIQKDDGCYEPHEMGAPPAHLASHGRANPAGIPYLYLASGADTAVSEVRPHTGEVATVAAFSLAEGLQLLDLRHPRITVSPFMLADETAVSLLRCDIQLLERLGQELTRPVLPESVATDYVPSQFLCEFIKKRGFSGVLYCSSVGDGINLALFNPECACVGDIVQHRVSRVVVQLESY